jgi:hypothetical protein
MRVLLSMTPEFSYSAMHSTAREGGGGSNGGDGGGDAGAAVARRL